LTRIDKRQAQIIARAIAEDIASYIETHSDDYNKFIDREKALVCFVKNSNEALPEI
jgi:hypothetical protein